MNFAKTYELYDEKSSQCVDALIFGVLLCSTCTGPGKASGVNCADDPDEDKSGIIIDTKLFLTSSHSRRVMSLLCHSCGGDPYPSLRTWQKEIATQLKSPNVQPEDLKFAMFRYIARELKAYAEKLTNELNDATVALQSAREFSAPISRISDDVLLYIFEEVFRDMPVQNTFDTCLNVALVCKRWRSIINATPLFWTRIYIPDEYHRRLNGNSIPPALKTQLVRAGESSRLSLHSKGTFDEPLFKILHPVLDRITCLELKLADISMDAILDTCSSLPRLIRLSLTLFLPTARSFWIDEGNIPGVDISLPKTKFPYLTQVEIKSQRPLTINLPWAQLEALKVSLCSKADFDPYPIFPHLERIKELKLDFGSFYIQLPIDDVRFKTIVLPHLRTATLSGSGPSPSLLQHSHLPSLKNLTLIVDRHHPLLVAAIANPGLQTIVQLHLDFGRPNEYRTQLDAAAVEELEQLLGSLQQLENLETFSFDLYGQKSFVERIFKFLSRDSSKRADQPVLPCLKELKISRAHFDVDALPLFRTFLEKRVSRIAVPVNGRKALRTVLVSFQWTSDPRPFPPWQKLFRKLAQYCDGETSVVFEVTHTGELFHRDDGDRLAEAVIRVLEPGV